MFAEYENGFEADATTATAARIIEPLMSNSAGTNMSASISAVIKDDSTFVTAPNIRANNLLKSKQKLSTATDHKSAKKGRSRRAAASAAIAASKGNRASADTSSSGL